MLVTSKQSPDDHLQNILLSTRGIIFIGTPHHGAGLAQWAGMMAQSINLIKQTNSDIIQALKRESETLARIQESFHSMIKGLRKDRLPEIDITCFYEELPLPGIGMVSE